MGNASCAGQRAPVGYSAYGRGQQVRRVFERHGDVADRSGSPVNHGIPLSHEPPDDPFEAVYEALAELHLDATPLQVAHAAEAAKINMALEHLDFDAFRCLLAEIESPMLAEPRVCPEALPFELPPLKGGVPGAHLSAFTKLSALCRTS